MSTTPLRRFLDGRGLTAEDFAAAWGFSVWSVRHWARGDKVPHFDKQRELEKATDGSVAPADWLAWRIDAVVEAQPATATSTPPAVAACSRCGERAEHPLVASCIFVHCPLRVREAA